MTRKELTASNILDTEKNWISPSIATSDRQPSVRASNTEGDGDALAKQNAFASLQQFAQTPLPNKEREFPQAKQVLVGQKMRFHSDHGNQATTLKWTFPKSDHSNDKFIWPPYRWVNIKNGLSYRAHYPPDNDAISQFKRIHKQKCKVGSHKWAT